MSKKIYRFFGGLLSAQEKWLNTMANKGYRLVRTGKMLYEFEACNPGQYQYRIEFVAHKSEQNAHEYAEFLEDCGYTVFFKNINLNYSVGKVKWRPWAEQGGKLATNGTTFNRELLIVEKENDGKNWDLHTTYEDKQSYYKSIRNPWLFIFITLVIAYILSKMLIWGIAAGGSLIPIILYQVEITRLKEQSKTKEW